METLFQPAPHLRTSEPRSQVGHVADVAQPTPDEYHNSVLSSFDPRPWRQGKTPGEVIMGAVDTRTASWAKQEAAVANVRAAGLRSAPAIEQVPLRRPEAREGPRA